LNIVDAQIHLWATETAERPWVRNAVAHWSVPLTAEIALSNMDAVGVDRALIVSPSWEGIYNDVVLAAARKYPSRLGAICRFQSDDPANSSLFEQWADDPAVYGVRVLDWGPTAGWLREGKMDWVWPAAAAAGLPVMIFAPGEYRTIGNIAAANPATKFIICHFGLNPTWRGDEVWLAIDDLLSLAQYENVAVKATSMPSFATDPYPFRSWWNPLQRIVSEFGGSRVFWGSDMSRLSCSYKQLYDLVRDDLSFLKEDEKTGILGASICAWLNWPSD
jgi:L-fuconolactonase